MGDRAAATLIRAASPARWQLWQLPRRVLKLVIFVHVATIGSTLATAWLFPVDRGHWGVAALLVGLGIVHLELSRNIERLRAKETGAGPYYDFKTVWNVAALLMLPPVL